MLELVKEKKIDLERKMPYMVVKVKPVQEVDLPNLWELEKKTWNYSNTPSIDNMEYESYSNRFQSRNILVALENDSLLGFVSYKTPTEMPAHSHQWELAIGVAPKAQGKGVGRLLIETIKKLAQEKGITKLSLQVLGSNQGAITFYKCMNFQQEAEKKKEFLINNVWIDEYHFAYFL